MRQEHATLCGRDHLHYRSYYIPVKVCVRVCMRACVHACVRVCMRACVGACVLGYQFCSVCLWCVGGLGWAVCVCIQVLFVSSLYA